VHEHFEHDTPEESVALNVRRAMIEVLGLTASFEEQRRYQQNVPFMKVPTELLQMWADLVPEVGQQPDWFGEPVFSANEVVAIHEYTGAVNRVHAAFPGYLPSLDALLASAEWDALRSAAQRTLGMFMAGGAC
jgi:hypothetical protein